MASPLIAELAQRNMTAMLQAMASVGQKEVAARLNLSETTISRYKAEDLQRLAEFLAAIGQRVVPADAPNVPREKYRAMVVLARDALDAQMSQWGSDL